MTTEERLAKLEEEVAVLLALVAPPPAPSLEEQHRLKVAARTLGAGKREK